MKVFLLDTTPLGQLCHPKASDQSDFIEWIKRVLESEIKVLIPEISDYELRRELIRIGSTESISRLDNFKNILGYVPLTTEVMVKAANFWAEARNKGIPTADDKSLDGDVILAAQATLFEGAIIVTANAKHLSRYGEAKKWDEIPI